MSGREQSLSPSVRSIGQLASCAARCVHYVTRMLQLLFVFYGVDPAAENSDIFSKLDYCLIGHSIFT